MAETYVLASAAARTSCLKYYFYYGRRRPRSGNSLIPGRILHVRIYGSGARPRNPPYTTFYYVRRRSCSAEIFSSQAESFYPEALVGASAVPTRASLAFDSMSAPCVGTLAPCRGADSPIRCGYLSLCCFRCSPRLFHRERYGGCTSSLHDAGPFTRSHSTREACHMRRQPVASCIMHPGFHSFCLVKSFRSF